MTRSSIEILVQILPRQKTCGWKHQTEVLIIASWAARRGLCKVTADTSAMPRASWQDREAKDDYPPRGITLSQAKGNGGQALIASLAVGNSGAKSGARS